MLLGRLKVERMMKFTESRSDCLQRSQGESYFSLKEQEESHKKAKGRRLYQAIEAHRFDLEVTRSVASGLDLTILDRRLDAVRQLLESLSQALELELQASPAIQKPSP
jgi:hypothetical protein